MARVFLGGTCNESTWRAELIQLLTINYFNPVVEDWTSECMEEELKQRKLCDSCLYCITPEVTGIYSIAEVVDDSNKRPCNTILGLLREANELVFNKEQWISLKALAAMVERNGSKVFYSLKDVATCLNTGVDSSAEN